MPCKALNGGPGHLSEFTSHHSPPGVASPAIWPLAFPQSHQLPAILRASAFPVPLPRVLFAQISHTLSLNLLQVFAPTSPSQ